MAQKNMSKNKQNCANKKCTNNDHNIIINTVNMKKKYSQESFDIE